MTQVGAVQASSNKVYSPLCRPGPDTLFQALPYSGPRRRNAVETSGCPAGRREAEAPCYHDAFLPKGLGPARIPHGSGYQPLPGGFMLLLLTLAASRGSGASWARFMGLSKQQANPSLVPSQISA